MGSQRRFGVALAFPASGRGIGAHFWGASKVVRALSSLSFSIEPGEGVGLIGENGAGKSTLDKVLTGLLLPTLGSVRTLGRVPFRERRRLGVWSKAAVALGSACRKHFPVVEGHVRDPEEIYRYTHASAVDPFELEGLLRVPACCRSGSGCAASSR